jgi:hypothetical protein
VTCPVRFEDDLGDLARIRPAGRDLLGAARRAAMEKHHVRVLGHHLVEHGPDALVIAVLDAAGEGDPGALRQEDLGIRTPACIDELPAVDHRGRHRRPVHHRTGPRPPRLLSSWGNLGRSEVAGGGAGGSLSAGPAPPGPAALSLSLRLLAARRLKAARQEAPPAVQGARRVPPGRARASPRRSAIPPRQCAAWAPRHRRGRRAGPRSRPRRSMPAGKHCRPAAAAAPAVSRCPPAAARPRGPCRPS